jgi:hypothetical protein
MSVSRIVLAVLLSFLCLGCDSKITRTDLVGTFIVNDSTSKDSIEVQPDGNYIHRYSTTSGGPELTSKGKWTFALEDGEPRITFEGFVWGQPFSDHIPEDFREKPSFWDVAITRSFDKVSLCINDDLAQWYVKK